MPSTKCIYKDLVNFCAYKTQNPELAEELTLKCALSCANSVYINQLPKSQRHGLSLMICKPVKRIIPPKKCICRPIITPPVCPCDINPCCKDRCMCVTITFTSK